MTLLAGFRSLAGLGVICLLGGGTHPAGSNVAAALRSATIVADRFVAVSDRVEGGSTRVVLIDCKTGRAVWRNRHSDEFAAPSPRGKIITGPNPYGLRLRGRHVSRRVC